MIIAINGQTISTDNIYKITPVSGYMFDVVSLNHHIIRIITNPELVLKTMEKVARAKGYDPFDVPSREAILAHGTKLLNQFRDEIIQAWSGNQGDIPKLTFSVQE